MSKIDGAIPTIVVDKDGAKSVEAAARTDALLGVEHAAFGGHDKIGATAYAKLDER